MQITGAKIAAHPIKKDVYPHVCGYSPFYASGHICTSTYINKLHFGEKNNKLQAHVCTWNLLFVICPLPNRLNILMNCLTFSFKEVIAIDSEI